MKGLKLGGAALALGLFTATGVTLLATGPAVAGTTTACQYSVAYDASSQTNSGISGDTGKIRPIVNANNDHTPSGRIDYIGGSPVNQTSGPAIDITSLSGTLSNGQTFTGTGNASRMSYQAADKVTIKTATICGQDHSSGSSTPPPPPVCNSNPVNGDVRFDYTPGDDFSGKYSYVGANPLCAGTTIAVGLHSYGTQGATWPTSGTQYFVDFQKAMLSATTTKTGTVTVKSPGSGCYYQVDPNIGTQAFDGKDGALPHYPDSPTPTNIVADGARNGGTKDCSATNPPTSSNPPSTAPPTTHSPSGNPSTSHAPHSSQPGSHSNVPSGPSTTPDQPGSNPSSGIPNHVPAGGNSQPTVSWFSAAHLTGLASLALAALIALVLLDGFGYVPVFDRLPLLRSVSTIGRGKRRRY